MESSAVKSRRSAGGRDDCWSDGATETLIEAWGHRYLKLNRGHLRQTDWTEVAHAVNSRDNGVKPHRTDVQCKNRVDTLKKKFKLEKSKSKSSIWPFYSRLDYLLNGGAVNPNRKSTAVKPDPNLNPNPNPSPVIYSSGSDNDSIGGDEEMVRKRKFEYVDQEITVYKELARAILRFGEIYERIESSKQQQIMELEKQRMEFSKELEVQRMNMFMEAQLQLEKSKRPAKHSQSAGNEAVSGSN